MINIYRGKEPLYSIAEIREMLNMANHHARESAIAAYY
jgi:hypothetical protein